MTRSPPWTDQENAALVALYFRMLDKAATGQSYNKAAMIRAVNGAHIEPAIATFSAYPLLARSRGSIEAKLMNATAAHRDCFVAVAVRADEPTTMDGFGYRALSNYQASLRDAMAAALSNRRWDAADTMDAPFGAIEC